VSNKKLPESHYNYDKLNVIFAIAALILLGAIGAFFMKDYDRQWKNYQKQFRTLEIEKARIKLDAATIELESDADFQDLEEEIKNAQSNIDANCSDLSNMEGEIKEFRTVNDITNQQYKQAKTQLDVAKYQYETAVGHHQGDPKEKKRILDEWAVKTKKLKLAVESSSTKIKEKEQFIRDCGKTVDDLIKKKRVLTTKRDLFQRKLNGIDPNEMDLTNRIGNLVRDLPIIDLSTPNYKIKQVVLKDITDDVIITQIPKVDRCVTCHMGIANADYKNAAQPLTSHPNLDLFLSNDSAHPIEEFGCTVCHGGRGRGTSFVSTVHVPSSKQEAQKWKEKYDWHQLHHWDKPMLPTQFTEASCFKCHSGEASIKGADKLSLGLQLIEKAGCYNCHQIDKYKNWPKSGPDLTRLSSKLTPDWAYKWIMDPTSFRHNAWMPSYFNQSNNDDPESIKRSQQEVKSIVHFLFAKSGKYNLNEVSGSGDFKKGEELVSTIGCFACHNIQPEKIDSKITHNDMRRELGPNLIGLGSKVSKKWIVDWLKNPNQYDHSTRMPNLRLTDEEVNDIAAFLLQDKNTTFDSIPVPVVDIDVLDGIVFGLLNRMQPNNVAKQKLSAMSKSDKLNYAGEKLISRYGCFSCHIIEGFENAKDIGTELTEEGNKNIHKLDFGFIHIDHSKHSWFNQKLKDPRIFDKDKVKRPLDKMVMPNFNFTDQEAEAITTALLGFVDPKTVQKKIKPRTPENLAIESGQEIVRQFNCQGCHIIEGEGAAIGEMIAKNLSAEGKTASEVEKFLPNFTPPNLYGVGGKVNPKWLFEFLHNPDVTIRPWLSTRMPTFNFNTAHLNKLVTYFNVLDSATFPFENEEDISISESEYKDGQKMFSSDYFDCMQCHVVGDKVPRSTQDAWAPDLMVAKTKIRPEWLIRWIKDPQKVVPGTKMPTFFDPEDFENSGPPDIFDGDENKQIIILRNFLMNLTVDEDKKSRKKEKKSEPTPEPPSPTTPEAAPSS